MDHLNAVSQFLLEVVRQPSWEIIRQLWSIWLGMLPYFVTAFALIWAWKSF